MIDSATFSTEQSPEVVRILDEYLRALEDGHQPQVDLLLRDSPELAQTLRPYLAKLEELHYAAINLRAPAPAGQSVDDVEQSTISTAGCLGDYRIIREAGRGGMGVVYEAEQISLGRRVALKVLPFAAVLDAKQLQRFKNEAHAAAQLHHTNIVPVFGVGCERGVHYYAMQFIEGSTLADVIHELGRMTRANDGAEEHRAQRASRMSTDLAPGDSGREKDPSSGAKLAAETSLAEGSSAALEAIAPQRSTRSPAFFRSVANLGIQAAEALEHAHELGVVHRDIKPSNLLLDERGNLWITDFGLARLESNPDLTLTGDILGTLRYMSPEQAAGKNLLLDHRTDIYSLGVTLYELLTLQPAIIGRDRQELLRQIAFEEPRLPRRVNSAIPTELETIVLKAGNKNPEQRYATAQDLADDLGRFLEDKPIRAKRPTLLERAAKWSRRHRSVVAAALVVMLVSVVALSVSTVMIWQEQARTRQAYRAERKQRQRAEASFQKAEKARDEAEAVTDFLAEMLAAADPWGEHDKDVTVVQALDRAAETIAEKFEDKPLIEARLRDTIGQTYRGLGEYDAAEPHLERALEIRRRRLGDEHPDTLTSMSHLALLYVEQARYDEAEPLYLRALETRKRVRGEEHRDTLDSMNHLAILYYKQARYDEAETLYLQTLETRKRVLGEDDPDTLSSMSNLAVLYADLGRYQEAEPLHRQAWKAYERVLGEDHPNTLTAISNLAELYRQQARYDEAEPLYLKALEARTRVLGEEHPLTLASLGNLAALYHGQGRWDEAEPLYLQELAAEKRVLGEEHPDTAGTMSNLANLYENLGRYEEAEGYLMRAVEIKRGVLGEEHPDTLIAMNNLGSVYLRQGRYEQAEPLYLQVLEARKRVRGEEHPDTLRTMNNLGVLYRRQRRYEQAEPLLLETLEKMKRVLGEGHPNTRAAMNNLAGAYSDQDRSEEAAALYLQALQTTKRVFGEDHPNTLTAMNNLAGAYSNHGRSAEAEALYRQVLEIKKRVLGEEHPDTLIAMTFLGSLLLDQDRAAEAEPLFLRALAGQRRVLPDGDFETRWSINNLANMYRGQGRHEEAEPLYREVIETAERVLPAGDYCVLVYRSGYGACLTKLERYQEAQEHLLAAYEGLTEAPGEEELRTRTLQRLVKLYEAWDAAEPEQGYAEKAAEWQTKLEAMDEDSPEPESELQADETPEEEEQSESDQRPERKRRV